MAARPPGLVAADGTHDRIVRAILPRPVDRTRSGDHHHVAGRRAGGAALAREHVEPAVLAGDLRPLEREALDDPVLGDWPAPVHMLDLADRRQAVVAQLHPVAAVEEQVALAVLTHRMAGIDEAVDPHVDRLAPRPLHAGRMDHIGLQGTARILVVQDGDVDEVAAVVLRDVERPDVADRRLERGGHRRPVHQVARMPDRHAGIVEEGGEGGVVIIPVLQHVRVGPIAGEHGIEVGAVAEISPALPFHRRAPARARAEEGAALGVARAPSDSVAPAEASAKRKVSRRFTVMFFSR